MSPKTGKTFFFLKIVSVFWVDLQRDSLVCVLGLRLA